MSGSNNAILITDRTSTRRVITVAEDLNTYAAVFVLLRLWVVAMTTDMTYRPMFPLCQHYIHHNVLLNCGGGTTLSHFSA